MPVLADPKAAGTARNGLRSHLLNVILGLTPPLLVLCPKMLAVIFNCHASLGRVLFQFPRPSLLVTRLILRQRFSMCGIEFFGGIIMNAYLLLVHSFPFLNHQIIKFPVSG